MTRTATPTRCPRCTGWIPNNETPGAYIGALSRADNATEVCSACGTDEALRQHFSNEMVPTHEWPIADAHRFVPAEIAGPR